jgi:hypothetical protein
VVGKLDNNIECCTNEKDNRSLQTYTINVKNIPLKGGEVGEGSRNLDKKKNTIHTS